MPDTTTLSLLLATGDKDLASKIRGDRLNIITTEDGFDAIKIAMAMKPDAVILDESLHGLPGPTIAIWLKLNPSTASIPVIGLDINGNGGWYETKVDACITRGQAEEISDEIVKDLEIIRASRKSDDDDPHREFDPLAVALELIDVYRERLHLSSTMMEIATIQHDLADYEHTVRMLMDAASQALRSEFFAFTILSDRTQYVLVRNSSFSLDNLKTLADENQRMLSEHQGRNIAIDQQVVFGRRRLSENTSDVLSSSRFFGHPIAIKGETLGYLTGLSPKQEVIRGWASGLLPDLTTQIALLLNDAQMLREHEAHLGELATILRAALETSSISPLEGMQTSNSLLQYLLIVLELCHTDRGCIVLFDQITNDVSDSASLGCNPAEILEESFRNGMNLADFIRNMSPEEVIIDTDPDAEVRTGRIIAPLGVGDKIMGGVVALGISESLNFRLIQALKTLAGMGGYFVYNTALYKQSVKSSIIEDQLNIAREIQRDMIPDTHPDHPGFDIFGRSQPARQVGGDFFDYMSFDNGRLQIAIADVSGKGIPASLLMTMTRALVIAASEKTDGPEEVLRDVNSHLVSRIWPDSS